MARHCVTGNLRSLSASLSVLCSQLSLLYFSFLAPVCHAKSFLPSNAPIVCLSVPPGTAHSHHVHWRWNEIHDRHVWPPAGAAGAESPELCQLHHWPVRGHLVRSWGPLSGGAQSKQQMGWPGVSGEALPPPQVRLTHEPWAALSLPAV